MLSEGEDLLDPLGQKGGECRIDLVTSPPTTQPVQVYKKALVHVLPIRAIFLRGR